MMNRLFRGLAPIAALAMAAGVTGCKDMNISINGDEGVPLAELDFAGKTAEQIVLASADTVIITQGEALDITVEGTQDVVDGMRFSLDEDTLAVSRTDGDWSGNDRATVRVTMPSLNAITMAGSGTIKAQGLSGNAAVTVAGSGQTVLTDVAAGQLDITVAGSGSIAASGTADKLELTVAGSGSAAMDELSVGEADVTVAGSGNAAFASDGKVSATIMGSGDINVTGSAECTAEVLGSGTLRCVDTVVTSTDGPPAPPEAPEPPAAPES